MFTVGESPPVSQANEKEQQTQQRWIQQVAGNPRRERFTNVTSQERERRLKIQREQRHGEQRCQQETEATATTNMYRSSKKYYNYNANETDEKRELGR